MKAPTAPPPATGCSPPPGSSPSRRSATSRTRSWPRRCAFGVLPIESSLAGPVNETHDLLWDRPLSIVAEAILPIHHCLVGPSRGRAGGGAGDPVAPRRARPVPEAARRHAVGDGDGRGDDRGRGRGGGRARRPTRGRHRQRAGRPHEPARRAGRQRRRPPRGVHAVRLRRSRTRGSTAVTGAWRTAFSFVTDHRPGSLHRAIEPLARRGIDLAQLVSRPIPQTPWRYRFDAVLAGHPLDDDVAGALARSAAGDAVLRVFGSYRADLEDPGATTVRRCREARRPAARQAASVVRAAAPRRVPAGTASRGPARGAARAG